MASWKPIWPRLIDQVADGVLTGAAIKDKLAALEGQRAVLEAELATEEAPTPASLHPGIAEHYRRVMGDLAQALHLSDSEAKDKLSVLEAQRAALEAELSAEEAPSPISLHPGIAEHSRIYIVMD